LPFRLDRFTAKIQFVTFSKMPAMIYRACQTTGTVSQTRYCQVAVCEKLSKDLDVPLGELLAMLPPPRGKAAALLTPPGGPRIGPANTDETVR
jgi:hypothetical protein